MMYDVLVEAISAMNTLSECYPEMAMSQQDYNQSGSTQFTPRTMAVYGDSIVRSFVIEAYLNEFHYHQEFASPSRLQALCERVTSNAAYAAFLRFIVTYMTEECGKAQSFLWHYSGLKNNERTLGTWLEAVIGRAAYEDNATPYSASSLSPGICSLLKAIYEFSRLNEDDARLMVQVARTGAQNLIDDECIQPSQRLD